METRCTYTPSVTVLFCRLVLSEMLYGHLLSCLSSNESGSELNRGSPHVDDVLTPSGFDGFVLWIRKFLVDELTDGRVSS